jgi:hypothetical protein
MNRYTIIIEEDPETGDLVLPFTDEILSAVGWKAGDTLNWTVNKDGSWTLEKKQDEPTE